MGLSPHLVIKDVQKVYSEESLDLIKEKIPGGLKQIDVDQIVMDEIMGDSPVNYEDVDRRSRFRIISTSPSLDKRIKKNSTEALKSFDKLARQTFGCESDATKALEQWKKKHPFILTSDEEIVSSIKYAKSGRPKKGDEGISAFSISARLSCLIDYREKEKKTSYDNSTILRAF